MLLNSRLHVDGHGHVYRIGDFNLEVLTKCAAFIAPSTISQVPKTELLFLFETLDDDPNIKLARKTFDALVQFGLALDSNDFVLIE